MIYVLSDIHGNRKNFDDVMGKINFGKEDSLYILGDVIDRYPHGIQLLRCIMEMPNVHMLLGNHEWMMMQALGIPYATTVGQAAGIPYSGTGSMRLGGAWRKRDAEGELLDLWYRNGGKATHREWDRLSESRQEEIAGYLSALPLSYDLTVNDGKYKLVHAIPMEWLQEVNHCCSIEWKAGIECIVWDRSMTDHTPQGDYTVIFGHTPTIHMQDNNPLEIWKAEKRIGIDCGSGFSAYQNLFYKKGRLACLRLDDMQVFYSD